ncbi:sulfur carrier protein ThiS [Gammaproteobacteria bacterium]|nr:sulfur carrier protein ThiS [Gammaproteobacteria bacterium]
MNILLNNKYETLFDGTTIQKLLENKNIKDKYFAVEINRKIIPKSLHCRHIIKDGDRIEIITAIGGG